MKKIILCPLFPPDVSEPAQYAKVLTTHLSEFSVIAFGPLPESVPEVEIVSIAKRAPLLASIRCLQKLLTLKPKSVVVLNGTLAELPALLYSFLSSAHLALIIHDKPAENGLRLLVHKILIKRADVLYLPEDSSVYLPQEKLPFTTYDYSRQNRYDAWWNAHIAQLQAHFNV